MSTKLWLPIFRFLVFSATVIGSCHSLAADKKERALKQAQAAFDKDDFDSTIRYCTKAIRLDPKDANTYGNRAAAYWKKGDFDGAIADYNETICLSPKCGQAYCYRSMAYFKKGEFIQAIADCNEAIRLDPKCAVAYCLRGWIYTNKGHFDQLIVESSKTLRPPLKKALIYFVGSKTASGNSNAFDQAIADCNEAIRLEPKDESAYRIRCELYFYKNDYGQAIADLAEVVGLVSKDGKAHEKTLIARVGAAEILECEVLGPVNRWVTNYKENIPPGEIEAIRKLKVAATLKQLMGEKLLYTGAKRELPREAFVRTENQLDDYYEKHEVEKLLKEEKVSSRDELDAKLRQTGSSLALSKRNFIEVSLGHEWMLQKAKQEISDAKILAYYDVYPDEFGTPAQVRWEELMARFSKAPTPTTPIDATELQNKPLAYTTKEPFADDLKELSNLDAQFSKKTARDAIHKMNNLLQQGKPFAKVAKELSDGDMASSGGQQGWVSEGSLASKELDQALFELPVGQLSPIIETKQGFHIVRVLERRESNRMSFADAKAQIRDKLGKRKIQEISQAFAEKLRKETNIITVFDDDSQQASQ